MQGDCTGLLVVIMTMLLKSWLFKTDPVKIIAEAVVCVPYRKLSDLVVHQMKVCLCGHQVTSL